MIVTVVFEFANFTTHRKTYKLEDFHIDLDTTDIGYSIGEIELMVEENGVATANKRIDKLAQELGE